MEERKGGRLATGFSLEWYETAEGWKKGRVEGWNLVFFHRDGFFW